MAAAVGIPVPAARSLFLAGSKAGVRTFKAKGTGVFYPAVPCSGSKRDDAVLLPSGVGTYKESSRTLGNAASHRVLPSIQSYTDVLYRKYSSVRVTCQICIGTFFEKSTG